MKKAGLALVLSFLCAFCSSVQAQTATSSSFILEAGDFQALDFKASSDNYAISGTSNPFSSDAYSYFLENNYGMFSFFVLTPTPEIYPSAFEVNLDKTAIDLTGLTPGILVQADTNIVVNSNVPAGYSIYVQQDNVLTNSDVYFGKEITERNTIANTACDANDCTVDSAGVWASNDTAGFGYSVAGIDSLADFAGGTKFRPFATAVRQEQPILIAQDTATDAYLANRQTQVIYKAGSATNNESGVYTNVINYTFVPNF
ncbi:MAG: hypothetical protein Q4G02_01175 [bacterium]|nr:hypothetical protein [bacterium]